MRLFLLLLLVFFCSPSWAACTNPSGVPGEVIYNKKYQVPQYCNDTDWIAMATKSPFGGMNSKGITRTSEYVSMFSGYIERFACEEPDKIVTIGTIAPLTSGHSFRHFIDLTVITSHRGYNNLQYFEYKHWVMMAGSHISSVLVKSGGTESNVELWDGTNAGLYNNIAITSDFDIQLKVSPRCGARRDSYYIVKYRPDAGFTPSEIRNW